jgi:hypothetical protein
MLRPAKSKPTEPKPWPRFLFEVVHISLGHGSIVVAVLAILSGIDHAFTFNYIESRKPYWIAMGFPLCLYYLLLLGQLTGLIDPQSLLRLNFVSNNNVLWETQPLSPSKNGASSENYNSTAEKK